MLHTTPTRSGQRVVVSLTLEAEEGSVVDITVFSDAQRRYAREISGRACSWWSSWWRVQRMYPQAYAVIAVRG